MDPVYCSCRQKMFCVSICKSRDALSVPVSRYQNHFTEMLSQNIVIGISIVCTLKGGNTLSITDTQ